MNSAILGLIAALSWGLNDFLARFPSRDAGPVPTVLAVTLAGFILLSIVIFGVSEVPPIVWPRLWLVVVAGCLYTLATLALFAALALGPISIVAPIAGSYPALAMIIAVAQGARPSLLQWLAVAAVMAGVGIVSRSGEHYERSGALAPSMLKTVLQLAFLAAICFAIALAASQAAVPVFGEIGTIWLARAFGLALIFALYLWRSPRAPMPVRWFPVFGLMGCLDVAAFGTITAGSKFPNPEFATVVSSAFGAVTVLLARLFLKEPIKPAQAGGMALIFGGAAALAGL